MVLACAASGRLEKKWVPIAAQLIDIRSSLGRFDTFQTVFRDHVCGAHACTIHSATLWVKLRLLLQGFLLLAFQALHYHFLVRLLLESSIESTWLEVPIYWVRLTRLIDLSRYELHRVLNLLFNQVFDSTSVQDFLKRLLSALLRPENLLCKHPQLLRHVLQAQLDILSTTLIRGHSIESDIIPALS